MLVEANAAGVPVIARDLGSCREVIKDGRDRFSGEQRNEAVRAMGRLSEIDRALAEAGSDNTFRSKPWWRRYERVYSTIFDLEAKNDNEAGHRQAIQQQPHPH